MALVTQQTTVTIEISMTLGPGQVRRNIYSLLNRVRLNCRRICLSRNTCSEFSSLQMIYNTTLNIEKGLFNADMGHADRAYAQLSSCSEMLRSTMPKLAAQAELDRPPSKVSGSPYATYLVLCDLHLVECLLRLAQYDMDAPSEKESTVAMKLLKSQQQGLKEILEARQQELAGKSPSALMAPKMASSDTDSMKQVADETFSPLTNALQPLSRSHLAAIIAHDECIYTELRKLKKQIEKIIEISHQSSFNRSKLRFLMARIDEEITLFTNVHFDNEFPNPHMQGDAFILNAPSPVKPPSLKNEDHVPATLSRPEATNDPPEVEDPDSFDLSDFMEPCEDTIQEQTTLPQPLLQAIDRLCQENEICDAVWSLSTRKPNLIIVNGKGITDNIKVKLEQAMFKQFPEFETQFINVELTSQNLAGAILRSTCNKHSPSPKWEPHEKATCEILLTGQQPHREHREVLYAVTSAHLLLHHKEMKEIENDDSHEQRKLELNRAEVNSRIGEHVYSLQPNSINGTPPLTLNLCNPALLAFRTCQHTAPISDASQSDTKTYDYMSDIALIPIETGNHERFMREWIKNTHMSLILAIQNFKVGQFKKFIASSAKVYANNREGRALPLPTDVNPTTSKPRALHLPFVLTKGDPFKPGDSGSLIYARYHGDDKQRLAIGILKGSRPPPEDHVYEAIVLKPAMEDIDYDYRHLVKSLKLFTGCQTRKPMSTGPRPCPS